MIRFLVFHGLNNLLTRNHMTKDHMDAEEKEQGGYVAAAELCACGISAAVG